MAWHIILHSGFNMLGEHIFRLLVWFIPLVHSLGRCVRETNREIGQIKVCSIKLLTQINPSTLLQPHIALISFFFSLFFKYVISVSFFPYKSIFYLKTYSMYVVCFLSNIFILCKNKFYVSHIFFLKNLFMFSNSSTMSIKLPLTVNMSTEVKCF